MMYGDSDPLGFIKSARNDPYNSSIASSASSSAASVWSDASSQSSDDTSLSATSFDSHEPCDSAPCYAQQTAIAQPEVACSRLRIEIPRELRKNPRRTSGSATSRSGCPPTLVRQCDRKVNFVDNLVDSSTQIVEAVWPLSSVVYRQELGNKAVLPLRTFIQETLRRSRTSYSTLQVALYYLILIKPHVPKYDFTMEQPDELHANRVLQCGRRMFLAALILASKYLQDRNYSARAWSKISGLTTQEINQNEMAFLAAVSWKLHITDEVFQRWTEIVLKYTPSQPPSPGSMNISSSLEQQNQRWRDIILKLEPELDNIEGLIPATSSKSRSREFVPISPRSVLASSRERACSFVTESVESTPTPKSYNAPVIMEPSPATIHTPGHLAPALGLLPTPRLTPQATGLSTPAASAACSILSGKGSMGLAMNQASHLAAAQNLDRWPGSISSSPQSYISTRRSSLANSISTASSPESMVSDSSRTSRSSSISSASSAVSAPFTKLDVQARCRYAKQCNERYGVRPTIASVPEDFEENCFTSSPESYTGPVSKDLLEMSLNTPVAQRGCDTDATSAARALQELQNYHQTTSQPQPQLTARPGSKRSRPLSIDNTLQENVRAMLSGQYLRADADVPEVTNRSLPAADSCRKRVCYSDAYLPTCNIPALHPAAGGPGGPGMWAGILN